MVDTDKASDMTEHLCNTYTLGCFRCALNKEEEEEEAMSNRPFIVIISVTDNNNSSLASGDFKHVIGPFIDFDAAEVEANRLRQIVNDKRKAHAKRKFPAEPYGNIDITIDALEPPHRADDCIVNCLASDISYEWWREANR